MSVVLFLILIGVIITVSSKKILGIYSHPGKSHQIFGEIILKSLARKGHEVTMVSAFPLKSEVPHYKDIYLDGFLEEINSNDEIYLEMEKNGFVSLIGTFGLIQHFTNKTFVHPAMKALVDSGEKFDLIIMDWFCKDAELFYGYVFQAPIIVTCSFGTQTMVNYLVNNPEPYSYVPVSGFPLADDMNFVDRVANTLGVLYTEAVMYYNKIQQQNILNAYFDNAPSIDEMRNNVALIFSNAHPVFESPRPYLPNVIPIGGLHIQDPKPLPQDLKEYLDKAKNGIVYFSLGSHMKTSVLPKYVLNSIFEAFSKIPQKVLMKWELNEIPNIPNNVLVRKWFEQDSILAHPNTKAFITHGGLLSKIEAIYYGVPMIGIPLFGDQKTNVVHSVNEGIAVQIKLNDLSEETLLKALNEIINNTSYNENIKKKSLILRNQPLKPLDAAIYWSEFVMNFNGSKHLQNKSMKLYKFQNLLIDVIAFLVAVFLLIVLIMTKLCKTVFKLIVGNDTEMKIIKKKKKK